MCFRHTPVSSGFVVYFTHPGTIIHASSAAPDRKSTRLNSSHLVISYAVFCLKKKIYPICPFAVAIMLYHAQSPLLHSTPTPDSTPAVPAVLVIACVQTRLLCKLVDARQTSI